MAKRKRTAVPAEAMIINKIHTFRGRKVMLDSDLAEMYGVEPKVLNQAVKRNIQRFPPDFMFRLNASEYENLKSQFVTSSWGGRRKLPYVFTEQGVSMLSGVLKSPIAIKVHIQIVRVFAGMKELLLGHKDILLKLERLEHDVKDNRQDISMIFEAVKKLLNPPAGKRKLIGFNRNDEEV